MHAGILEDKMARFQFKADANEHFLFTTPNYEQMFKSDADTSTWYLTVRTWHPAASAMTADDIVHFFETKFAEQAQKLPGFKMYFGCVIVDDNGVDTAVRVVARPTQPLSFSFFCAAWTFSPTPFASSQTRVEPSCSAVLHEHFRD